MRCADTFTESLFTLSQLEDFIPENHPLRPFREMVNAALAKMDALFSRMYEAHAKGGRPIIARHWRQHGSQIHREIRLPR